MVTFILGNQLVMSANLLTMVASGIPNKLPEIGNLLSDRLNYAQSFFIPALLKFGLCMGMDYIQHCAPALINCIQANEMEKCIRTRKCDGHSIDNCIDSFYDESGKVPNPKVFNYLPEFDLIKPMFEKW